MPGIISIASSALLANYAQLQTTGHNIANANTPGYSRQEVVLGTAGSAYTGGGYLGRGVAIADVLRRSDQFLSSELALSGAVQAGDVARSRELNRLQSLFSDSETGIGAAYDDWQLALSDLANQPGDGSSRAAVLVRADTLASRIRGIDQQVDAMQGSLNERIRQTTQAVNGLFGQLARVNQQISSSSGTGQVPNDLLDQRDQLVEKINSSMRVTTFINQDNTANVFTIAGQGLVIGRNAERLTTQNSPADPSQQQVTLVAQGTTTILDALGLGGGELAGLLRVRDDDLVAARAALGQLAAGIAAGFNQQQARGLDLNGQPGAALFSTGQAVAISSAQNTGNAQIALALSDASRLAASDYSLSFNGSQYALTRASDGTVQTLAGLPASIDGFSIALSGTPAVGDVFTLKVASQMAGDFRRVLAAPNGLAAAFGVTAQPSGSNTGDGRISQFAVTASNVNQNAPVTFTFTSPTTFNVSGTGTGNPTGVTYVAGQTVSFNGWALQLSGVPQSGDTFSVSPTSALASDNRNARALLDIGQSRLVNGQSVTDAYASLIADVGTRAQSADSARTQSKRLLDNASAARAAESGVNLDEEAAHLLQYQQAYQASAKLMATAQTMFEALLAATTR
jgi:flagellar hook-associated protein 1